MYIISLICSILAFVCSFVPLFGIPFSLFSSIIAIILSIIVFKKEKAKDRKDASIIALVVSIVAIIICIIVNLLSAKFISNIFDSILSIDSINYNEYYVEKFENYKEYSQKDSIVIKDSLVLNIKEIANNNNEYNIKISVSSLENNTYFSIYNFGLFNNSENEFVYSSSSVKDNEFISGILNEGEERNIVLRYKLNNEVKDKLYLVFVDNENGVKIEL